jgi:1-phosphatidylinositol-3-phosphate 5-kinase
MYGLVNSSFVAGQIFCSRCASNIIKGTRFGHDGQIRVCNLCLEKLATVDDEDDDDRRSVVSSVTSFPAHQFGIDAFSKLGHHPQSPFAASQLFGRTDEPFNLYSIAETKRPITGSDESDYEFRPVTPLQEREDGIWEPVQENPAPFRRALSDEEKDAATLSNGFHSGDSPGALGTKTPVDFPTAMPINLDGPMSSIQFPIGSPGDGLDSPRPRSRRRSRFNSYGDFDVATPFIRSRVQSRLDSISLGEPGWRTRRESTASVILSARVRHYRLIITFSRYAHELNLASMLHLKIMLRQMLTSENIPNLKDWEETLLKLSLRIARDLTFTTLPHRQGEDMDVRRYVKIKKIPGGVPQDSEYVDGAVITKNVAHKDMSRSQRNPRIMLITFPIEFHRVEGQYMPFGQILRQEKEYLGNLVSRISALRPHVLLVEKSVSRVALDGLVKQNIAVARLVEPSAIQTIARMTQGDVFSSMDKLALEPRLGHCGRYRIQTYDHPLIPGRRKTYMRFEGCNRDMGCTLILRGADIETLRRIKKVTRFLTFIVRNLKLETHLWKDSVITLPSFNSDAIPSSMSGRNVNQAFFLTSIANSSSSTPRLTTPTAELNDSPHAAISEVNREDEDLPSEDSEQLRLSRRIQQSLDAYRTTFISVSATLRFPPPYPVRRMKELDNQLLEAKRAWEDEIIRREEKLHSTHMSEVAVIEATPNAPSQPEPLNNSGHDDISAQIDALPSVDLSRNSPSSGVFSPGLEEEGSSYFVNPPKIAQSGVFVESSITSPMLEERPEAVKTPADIALESNYSLIKWKHEEQRRIWEWYLRKNSDDFVVEKYQCVSLWEYTIPNAEFGQHRACFAPKLNYITFYGENDCTLGQYIERSVGDTLVQFLDPKAICTGKGCDKPLARHCKVYVHNEIRLFVAVEQWDGQIIGRLNYYPAPDLITTWSACRVCGSATPFIPVSEEMQRYSFAKFLELHFYPADVKLVQGAGCQHNIYQHHIRYFASKGMTVRFQTDAVTMHEVVYPPFRIRVRPETQLELKNADFERLHQRNLMWYTGLVDDLKLISIDAATGDEETDARLLIDINVLIARAEAEREDISRLINRIYRTSPPTDTLALNQVHSYRQDKIVAWQHDFDRLPKPRAIHTMERIGKRSSAFGSVRARWPLGYGLSGAFDNPHLPWTNISEAEEGLSTLRRVTSDSLNSSASEASEPETNPEPSGKETSPENVSSTSASPEEVKPDDTAAPSTPAAEVNTKSDPESDSTIGAVRDEVVPDPVVPVSCHRKSLMFFC